MHLPCYKRNLGSRNLSATVLEILDVFHYPKGNISKRFHSENLPRINSVCTLQGSAENHNR